MTDVTQSLCSFLSTLAATALTVLSTFLPRENPVEVALFSMAVYAAIGLLSLSLSIQTIRILKRDRHVDPAP